MKHFRNAKGLSLLLAWILIAVLSAVSVSAEPVNYVPPTPAENAVRAVAGFPSWLRAKAEYAAVDWADQTGNPELRRAVVLTLYQADSLRNRVDQDRAARHRTGDPHDSGDCRCRCPGCSGSQAGPLKTGESLRLARVDA